MAKKKLVEDVKRNPARFHRSPADVVRDRRFTDEERLAILAAWERGARHPGGDDDDQLRQISEARSEIERRLPSAHE